MMSLIMSLMMSIKISIFVDNDDRNSWYYVNFIFSDFTKFYNGIHGNCFIFNSGWNASIPVVPSEKTGRRYGNPICKKERVYSDHRSNLMLAYYYLFKV